MKRLTLFVLCLLLLSFPTCVLAQQQTKESGAKSNAGQQVTMTGKIDYMKALGGYFVRGENPPTELIIDNQNQKVLKGLHQSKKSVNIKGHLTIGADHLFIESIDGRPYQGKKASAKVAR